MNMTREEIIETMHKYVWYHRIQVLPDVFTEGNFVFDRLCDFIYGNMKQYDYKNKSVLDIGARDCLHSLRAEKLGASRVVAIDNDISAGARDFVIPLLNSKVETRHQNLYSIEEVNQFDIVQFFGVLYHLRFPFGGIKKVVDATKVGGTILIEGGFLVADVLKDLEILWCPTEERSPYENSSVTFFNACAMDATMKSFGCEKLAEPKYWDEPAVREVKRGFLAYTKTKELNYPYWNGLHKMHTKGGAMGGTMLPETTMP